MPGRPLSMRPEWEDALCRGRKTIDARPMADAIADLNSSTLQEKCPLSVHAGKGRQAAEIRFPLCVELFRRPALAEVVVRRSRPPAPFGALEAWSG